MATIRKKGRGWQVIICRSDDHPPVCRSGFDTKQEAKDWTVEEEVRRRQADYFPDQLLKKYTLAQTIDNYIENSLPKRKVLATRHRRWIACNSIAAQRIHTIYIDTAITRD